MVRDTAIGGNYNGSDVRTQLPEQVPKLGRGREALQENSNQSLGPGFCNEG